MNILSLLYTEILWRPIFNGLVFFYNILPGHDAALAIIVLTVSLRLLLLPLYLKAQKSQRDLARVQPEIKRVQEQFKNDREAQGKALMEVYAKYGVNPFSGCLVMLLQIPVLIAMFSVFRHGFQADQMHYLYSFISHPAGISLIGFGFLNLAASSKILGAMAAVTQYIQTKLTLPPPPAGGSAKGSRTKDFSQMMQAQTLYIFPALIFFWSFTFPSALMIYWTTQNLFGILQELVVKKFQPIKDQK